MVEEEHDDCRSRADIESALRSFSAAELARLTAVSKASSFKTGWDPEDLLQEAIVRTLQGTRNCPLTVDLIKHLVDTMSSIADGEREKARNSMPHVATAYPGQEDSDEQIALDWSAEEIMEYEGGRDEVLAMFDDDPTAREMLEGIMAGFDTEQLKELTGLQGTAYNSKRTLIRRRLLKLSPEERKK